VAGGLYGALGVRPLAKIGKLLPPDDPQPAFGNPILQVRTPKRPKVFWFFFSKKNILSFRSEAWLSTDEPALPRSASRLEAQIVAASSFASRSK
jgi:hypothetical protein